MGGPRAALRKAWNLYRRHGMAGVRHGLAIVSMRALRPGAAERNDYAAWVRRYDTLDEQGRAALCARVAAVDCPLISILMPVYNPEPRWLEAAIESVRAQIYPNWELCIADDASTDPAVQEVLRRFQGLDCRVKVVFREQNGHISAASNSALACASGEWICLLDHDDLLAEHALFWVADAIRGHPGAAILYSDEDKINGAGKRSEPHFKPDWNYTLFLSYNFVSHLGVYRKVLIDEVGGFRLGFEGAQDYDLALRCIERVRPAQIVHVPRVLYHWRIHGASTAQDGQTKPYALQAGEKALNEHFKRTGTDAHAVLQPRGYYRTQFSAPQDLPLVSVIVPTRNGAKLVRQCLDSLRDKTGYDNYEVILVDNGSDDPVALRYFQELRSDPLIRVVRDDRPFNYSALNNAAVAQARGEFVLLMNNDVEAIRPGWLTEMVSWGMQPGVGTVGARLLYPNGDLQHGGVILGLGGVAGHGHKYFPGNHPGYFYRAILTQELSALTAACLLVRKSIYEQVGGLNEAQLAVAFNDVDFCLRVRDAGYRNIYASYAELYHHESVTRGNEDTPEKQARFRRESDYMEAFWGAALRTDPAYNPNLTLDYEDFSYAWPPREPLLPAGTSDQNGNDEK